MNQGHQTTLPARLDLSALDYHRDAVGDTPTLSASILNTLLQRSPLHAWHAHPKLNENFAPKTDERFDIGTCVHAWFLEGEQAFDVLAYDSWKTKDAREYREESRAHGRIPLLAKDADRVLEMCDALTRQTEARGLFDRKIGRTEVTVAWSESGVACRSRIDWLATDLSMILDLKTTKSSTLANWERAAHSIGSPRQAAFYRRAARALDPTRIIPTDFKFVVIEVEPPYAIRVVPIGNSALDLSERQIDYGLALWAKCLRDGSWPGFEDEVPIEAPAWAEMAWLEREAREEIAA